MVGGWLKFLLILRLTQPSLAGVGAEAELGNIPLFIPFLRLWIQHWNDVNSGGGNE